MASLYASEAFSIQVRISLIAASLNVMASIGASLLCKCAKWTAECARAIFKEAELDIAVFSSSLHAMGNLDICS